MIEFLIIVCFVCRQSDTCDLLVPELELESGSRSLCGRFTTVEGMLRAMQEQLAGLAGDSNTAEDTRRMDRWVILLFILTQCCDLMVSESKCISFERNFHFLFSVAGECNSVVYTQCMEKWVILLRTLTRHLRSSGYRNNVYSDRIFFYEI